MKPIFEYLDYCHYLGDFYEEQKQKNRFFSYRYMAGKLGMDHSLLVKIFAGKRHIADDHVAAFRKLCGLTGNEARYFDALVSFCKARNDKQAKIFLERMLDLQSVSSTTLSKAQYRYFQKWYYAAVRAILDIHPCDGNLSELARRLNPAITEEQAREALELLTTLGLVVREKNGMYRVTENHVTTGESWASIAISQFQEETIKLSTQCIQGIPREQRDVSSLTMSMDEETFEDVKLILRECREAIKKRINRIPDAQCDRVYQLNFQFFPMSRIEKSQP